MCLLFSVHHSALFLTNTFNVNRVIYDQKIDINISEKLYNLYP